MENDTALYHEFILYDDDAVEEHGPTMEQKECNKNKQKKYCEYGKKIKVATEVSKHRNIFDITDPKYSDKIKEAESWRQISEATGIDAINCKKMWTSLRNSAKYHANEKKLPYKSGAAASEIVCEKYRPEWQYKDVMEFYTVPKHRPTKRMISVTNTSESSDQSQSQSPPDSFLDSVYDQSCAASSQPKKKDRMLENISTLTTSFSTFLEKRSRETNQSLKYFGMWANFDSLVSKLDEDEIIDLNIDIIHLISAAVKRNRDRRQN